ncbi:intermembrane phospholipid transport protein YdbH family protein [Alcanivorax quisquiliarum]|uniref:YdbH domain-containing protein n=1 Tax=Alcanivorax quisquiliarum TaxID=2933565 RepID=A0ABT0E7J5_9GAMM|nr:YdbH domain-containing protein [Alcanivorax quisquiliarum]MCK0537808.1 YdbH domain-containing protein [Alcanivorax quisquiliarum]
MTSTPANKPRRTRVRRWRVLWLAVLLLSWLVILALWLLWRASGIAVQDVTWQGGLHVERWSWSRAGCEVIRGEGVAVPLRWPLKAHLASVHWQGCPDAHIEEAPTTPLSELRVPSLPRTPPFSLQIDALHWPGLPPAALTLELRDQHWTLIARQQGNTATLQLARLDGEWSLAADVALPALAPDWLGNITAHASGTLVDGRPAGSLVAEASRLGHRSQPQRADARLNAQLDAQRWAAALALTGPIALPGGWVVDTGEALAASGDLDAGLEAVQANVRAVGPAGALRLTLASQAPGAAQGAGHISLTGEAMQGELPLSWDGRQLTLAPARLTFNAVQLSWDTPLVVPLALHGDVHLPLVARWQALMLSAPQSRLAWDGSDWQWQGALRLAGHWNDYQLSGDWRGSVAAEGAQGEPARLAIEHPDMQLLVQVPVAQLAPPDWRVPIRFDGQYQAFPLTGELEAGYHGQQLQGVLRADSRLALLDQGGELHLALPWQWTGERLRLLPGELQMRRGLFGTVLVYPLKLTNPQPLYLDADGLHGTLALAGEGALAERWRVPALTGTLSVAGLAGELALAIRDWQSTLNLVAAQRQDGFAGELALFTPLSPELSQGLGVMFRGGLLEGDAQWRWDGAEPVLDGRLRLRDLQLDWGGIRADGGAGELRLAVRGEAVRLASVGPLTLDELDIGTPIRNVRMTLDDGDLATWQVSDIYADVLGGYLRAPMLTWPSPAFQTIVISRIDLDRVAALQPDPVVQLAGRVGGFLPLQLGATHVAVQGGRLANEEPLALLLTPSAGTEAMANSNRAVQLALESLSVLQIDDFLAAVDMSADGWLDGAVTLRGVNPQRKGLPVVFNYTHRENVLVLLRSLRIGDEISRQVMERQPGGLR